MRSLKIMFAVLLVMFVAVGCSDDSSNPLLPDSGAEQAAATEGEREDPTDITFSASVPGAAELASFGAGAGEMEPGGYYPEKPRFTYTTDDYYDYSSGRRGPWVTSFRVSFDKAGDYLLTYRTWYGSFNIIFRADRSATVMVFMNYRDYLFDLSISEGTINEGVVAAQGIYGPVTVFGQLPAVSEQVGAFTSMATYPLRIAINSGVYGTPPWVGWSWD